jgi:hypothetical protein
MVAKALCGYFLRHLGWGSLDAGLLGGPLEGAPQVGRIDRCADLAGEDEAGPC